RVRAELVHEPPALLSADPAPPGQRDAAVERDRHLVGHEGPLPGYPGPPRLVQHARVEPVDELDVDTCIAETFFAACRFRIRVARAEDDAFQSRSEDRFRARRSGAVVRAGL